MISCRQWLVERVACSASARLRLRYLVAFNSLRRRRRCRTSTPMTGHTQRLCFLCVHRHRIREWRSLLTGIPVSDRGLHLILPSKRRLGKAFGNTIQSLNGGAWSRGRSTCAMTGPCRLFGYRFRARNRRWHSGNDPEARYAPIGTPEEAGSASTEHGFARS